MKMAFLLLAVLIHDTIRRKAIANGTAGRALACWRNIHRLLRDHLNRVFLLACSTNSAR